MAAINAPIQGSAADVIKRAMIRAPRVLAEAGPTERMLLQVHDELLFEVPHAEAEQTSQLVRDVMAGAPEPAVTLDVPLIADAETGDNGGGRIDPAQTALSPVRQTRSFDGHEISGFFFPLFDMLNGLRCSKPGLSHLTEDGSSEVVGPAGSFAFSAYGDVGAGASQDVEGEFSKDGQVFGAVLASVAFLVFVKGFIENPM